MIADKRETTGGYPSRHRSLDELLASVSKAVSGTSAAAPAVAAAAAVASGGYPSLRSASTDSLGGLKAAHSSPSRLDAEPSFAQPREKLTPRSGFETRASPRSANGKRSPASPLVSSASPRQPASSSSAFGLPRALSPGSSPPSPLPLQQQQQRRQQDQQHQPQASAQPLRPSPSPASSPPSSSSSSVPRGVPPRPPPTLPSIPPAPAAAPSPSSSSSASSFLPAGAAAPPGAAMRPPRPRPSGATPSTPPKRLERLPEGSSARSSSSKAVHRSSSERLRISAGSPQVQELPRGRARSSSPAPFLKSQQKLQASDVRLDETALLSASARSVVVPAPGSQEEKLSLENIQQVFFRRKGLQSLRVPGTVDFSELVSLRVLSLSHNMLTEIGPVSSLPALQELNVNQNRITDLSPAFQCETLEVLLAANNCVTTLEGLALPSLSRLSLFSNHIADFEALSSALVNLPRLASLDLGGNPCVDDVAERYQLLRTLPALKDYDGETVKSVDRALAEEFLVAVSELGFEAERRPKTAPAATEIGRGLSSSPLKRGSWLIDKEANKTGVSSTTSSTAKALPQDREALAAHVEALHLRLRTVQVECENLRRQLSEQRRSEPDLDAAALRDELATLEGRARDMHSLMDQNLQERQEIERLEAEYHRKRLELGVPEESQRPSSALRPRTGLSGHRPGSAGAVAEAMMRLSTATLESGAERALKMPQSTKAELQARNAALKRELRLCTQEMSELRTGACSVALGRPLSSHGDDD